jgi:predicted enzyme related to lactoylglutathione lyase
MKMPTRDSAPTGSPCWADLFTSDPEGAGHFYGELFGWEAQEPSAEFGGYFMFTRDGVPIAGAMGDMGEQKADNSWKIYLACDDAAKTAELVESAGGQVLVPGMPVADLGVQLVLVDPTGAPLGSWQPGTFPGFTVLGEHGSPSWFELLTRDHAAAVSFYETVFGWETRVESDTDEFRYTTMVHPSGEGDLAGVMDAATSLAEGEGSSWFVYWQVDDVDAAVAKAVELGGTILQPAHDSPYGRLAGLADPTAARFKLIHAGE